MGYSSVKLVPPSSCLFLRLVRLNTLVCTYTHAHFRHETLNFNPQDGLIFNRIHWGTVFSVLPQIAVMLLVQARRRARYAHTHPAARTIAQRPHTPSAGAAFFW